MRKERIRGKSVPLAKWRPWSPANALYGVNKNEWMHTFSENLEALQTRALLSAETWIRTCCEGLAVIYTRFWHQQIHRFKRVVEPLKPFKHVLWCPQIKPRHTVWKFHMYHLIPWTNTANTLSGDSTHSCTNHTRRHTHTNSFRQKWNALQPHALTRAHIGESTHACSRKARKQFNQSRKALQKHFCSTAYTHASPHACDARAH